MDFDGETYEPALDKARLTAQYSRVFETMANGLFYTLKQLEELTKAPQASISARIRDMRKERFGSHTITRRRVEGGTYEYKLTINKGKL